MLSIPGAEKRVVVAEAGARESLTIPLLNTKTLLPMVKNKAKIKSAKASGITKTRLFKYIENFTSKN